MPEQVVLEAEAVEEPSSEDVDAVEQPTRLPQRSPRTDVEAWRGEVVKRYRLYELPLSAQ